MKYIKNWNIFESIKIKSKPTIYKELGLVGFQGSNKTTFADKDFNSELLSDDFIEDLKFTLYELSEDCDIEISFMRTIPVFKPKIEIGVTDLMVINIKPQESDWWKSFRRFDDDGISRFQKPDKRNYINNKILENISYEIQSLVREYDLEFGISQSYLPFSSIEEFFKYRSLTDHLLDVNIIVFKKETPT